MCVENVTTRIFEIKKNFALFSAANETSRPADRRKSFAFLDRRNPMKCVRWIYDHRAGRELKFLFSGGGLNDQRATFISFRLSQEQRKGYIGAHAAHQRIIDVGAVLLARPVAADHQWRQRLGPHGQLEY